MKKRKNKILYKILMPIMLLAALFMFNGAYAIETEKTVIFEVLTYEDGEGTVTEGTYNNISLYITYDELGYFNNIISIKKNNIESDPLSQSSENFKYLFYWEYEGDDTNLIINSNDTFDNDGSIINHEVGDVWEIIFLVNIEPQGTIIEVLSDWVGGFTTLIISVVQSMIPIFWLEGTGLTLVGMLSLMAVGIGLIYLGLRFILQLFPGSHQL